MNLKLKKNFIIIEEVLHKLYYLIILITFLKIYFSTKHNIQKHIIKWSSIGKGTNNWINMWMNLTHTIYIFFKK